MPELGRAALIVVCIAASWALIAGIAAGLTRDRRVLRSGRNALLAALVAVLVADAVLMTAIVRHDFRFDVVWRTTSETLPMPYLATSFWASQEGSLLLWLTVLVAFAAIAVVRQGNRLLDLQPWVVAIFGGIAGFFALMLTVSASPFATGPMRPDGVGLDPALQNPYMVAHPPTLYLGYVGLAVPFAFCMAALLARRADAQWIDTTRRWTLATWAFLGIGMLLGAHWAYVELGWGGYWAWDPVENAALMPWLVGPRSCTPS